MDYYVLLDKRGHVTIPAYSDPTDGWLVKMVARMRDTGWTVDDIRAFFVEHPVTNLSSILERAGVPS